MVSTFTTRKRLEKQTPGENNNSWGTNLNQGTIDLVDECFGIVCVAMTTNGDANLSQANGTTDQGRRSQIILTGAPTSSVRLFVPAVESFYLVRNKMTGSNRVRLTNLGGTNGVDFSGSGSGAEQGLVISDGTNVREVFRTVSIGGFTAFTSTVLAAVSDVTTDATGGDPGDSIQFFDKSENGARNNVPVSTFFDNYVEGLTEETTVSVSDAFPMYDESATTLKRSTVQSLLKVINTLTEETTPQVSVDYMLVHNTSVGGPRKISVQNATKFINSGTKTGNYTVTTGDRNGSITYSGMSADATLTLPTAASFGIGNIFWFSHEDTSTSNYAVTFDGNGSETIDGFTTRKCSRGTRLGLMAISGGWKTVTGNWVFLTSQQTVDTTDGSTIAHGLGVKPDNLFWYLICLSTDSGYSVGDQVTTYSTDAGSSNYSGIMVGGDATNLFYRMAAAAFRIPNKTTGAHSIPTFSNWALVIGARV
jgi:hypothetical protein